MTEPAVQSPDIVEHALSKVTQIATLPEVTAQIVSVVDDPDTTAEDLEALVSSDPVLSVRVLKVVNSAFYGMPGEVSSIKQAIVVLGMSGVKNIAIAAGISKLFRGGKVHESFDAQDLWRHSAAVAAAARLIAEKTRDDRDGVFLIGLLHDLGVMIEMQALRPQLIEVIEAMAANSSLTFLQAERQIIGATHQEFGLALCRNWNFPEPFQAAVGFHHTPELAPPEHQRNAQLICLADHLAGESCIGYCGTVDREPFPDSVVEALGLSSDDLQDVRDRLPEMFALADQLSD
ncbi:MAG: HDOD domain-containing protein [Pseudomonadota bacterium]